MNFLITFQNVHFVLKGEKELEKAHVSVKVIPLPLSLGSLCNMCLRIQDRDIQNILLILKEKSIPIKDVFQIKGTEEERIYLKWGA